LLADGVSLLALTGLTLACVLLFGRRESLARATATAGSATLALIVALVIVGGLAGGRFLMEAWLAAVQG